MPRARLHPRSHRAARLPEVGLRGGVSDLCAGAGRQVWGRLRELRSRCGRAALEMASAGGGDCEGAAHEADRPHQRPFLIGVSGGTASGKVRGRAARRGLSVTLAPWDSGLSPETDPSPWLPRCPLPGVGCGHGWPSLGRGAGGERGAGRWTSAPPPPPASLPLAWPLVARAPRPSRQAQPHPSLAGLSLAGPLERVGQGERLQAGILSVCSQSTVCEKIMELLGQNEVDHRQRKLVILSQDRFYKVLTTEQKAKALKGQYNFDHPGRDPEAGEGVGKEGRPRRLGPGLDLDSRRPKWFHEITQITCGGASFPRSLGPGWPCRSSRLPWSQSGSLPSEPLLCHDYGHRERHATSHVKGPLHRPRPLWPFIPPPALGQSPREASSGSSG